MWRVDEADRVRRYVIITSVIIVGCVERHSMRRLDPRCCSTLRTLNKRMIHAEQCITVHYIAVKYTAVQYSTLQYSTLQYSTVQYCGYLEGCIRVVPTPSIRSEHTGQQLPEGPQQPALSQVPHTDTPCIHPLSLKPSSYFTCSYIVWLEWELLNAITIDSSHSAERSGLRKSGRNGGGKRAEEGD